MEYQDKEDFLKKAMRDTKGNLYIKTNLDGLKDKPVVK